MSPDGGSKTKDIRQHKRLLDATKLKRDGEWKPKKAVDLKLAFTPFNQQDEVEGISSGQATPGLQIDATQLVEPLDFYKLFLTDAMVEKHVAETNKHAQAVKDRDARKMKPNSRAHKWTDTTVVEMLQFKVGGVQQNLVEI